MMPRPGAALLLLAMMATTVHAAAEGTEPEHIKIVEVEQDTQYKDSWWHAAHEATMDRQEHDPDATSPVRCSPPVLYRAAPGLNRWLRAQESELMNDFDIYLHEILLTYGQEEDRSEELLDIVRKQYKHIEWTVQPFEDEYVPQADFMAQHAEHDIEEHTEEMSRIDLIAHYLHEIFFHYKTKEEADAMVKVRF
jgi:hypothetical protein